MSSEKNVPPAIEPQAPSPRPDAVGTSTRTPTPPPPPPPASDTNGTTSGNGTTSRDKTASDGDAHRDVATPPEAPEAPDAASAGPIDAATVAGMERSSGESKVAVARAGAVKAAAAALAAARSAAKKVTTPAPTTSDPTAGTLAAPTTADDNSEDTPLAAQPTKVSTSKASSRTTASVDPMTSAPKASDPPGATMHYAAGGVTGTATALPPEATVPTSAAATEPRATPAPTTGTTPAVRSNDGAPRRVRLAISKVSPWSVMKLAFLLSFAIAIMMVVASAVFWSVLDGLHVFTKVQDFVEQVVGTETETDVLQFVAFSRVVSLAALFGAINVVLMTALATILAFLYNITATLVGGLHLTLTDD